MNDKNKSNKDKPKRLGRYMVRDVLGSGTHGYVYRGYDPYVGRQVAIKIENYVEKKGDEDNLNAHQTLFNEARTTGFLHHPNIVALYDVGVESDVYYIVMEYVEGKTLAHYCSENNTTLSSNPKKAIEVAQECCLALDYSHTNNVLHRDIKPSNIMITARGSAKIMDFSIAHSIAAATESKVVVGSPTYMSPEQITGNKLTQASDQFSLAVVLYYLLCKKPPLYSNKVKELFKLILNEIPPPLSNFRSDLPADLENIILKAMSKKPEQRFASCKEFGEEMVKVYTSPSKTKVSKAKQNDVISNLSFFQNFDQDQIEEVVHSSNLIHYKDKQEIVKEGMVSPDFYILVSGQVEIIKKNKSIAVLKKGDCFGEVAFLGKNMNLKRIATGISRGESLCLKVKANAVESFSTETQLNCYKAFSENLAYRVSVLSAMIMRSK